MGETPWRFKSSLPHHRDVLGFSAMNYGATLDPPRRVAYQAVRSIYRAAVAELVDALASGASGGNPVEVQVLSSAPFLSKASYVNLVYLYNRIHNCCHVSCPSDIITLVFYCLGIICYFD